MKKYNSNLESNDEVQRNLHRRTLQRHSTDEENKQRRIREWRLQQKFQEEHEKLKQRKISEYEKNRARKLKSLSTTESNSKTRDRSLEKTTKATSSKSSVMTEKLDTSGNSGSTTKFQGPEGIKICEEDLNSFTVTIHRNLSVEMPSNEINREIVKPEEIVIQRRYGEGSKPIFEREDIQSSSKDHKEIKEPRTVITIGSRDTGNKSKSFRRLSPSSNLLNVQRRSQRSSSSQRSRRRESKDSNSKSDCNISKRSDRRESREKYGERDRKDSRHDQPSSSSSRYRSSQNKESSYQEHKNYRHDDSSPKRDFSHRSESRKDDKEEESSRFRNYSSSRDGRSRSRSRSRDRYRKRRMIPSHCIDQMPYPVRNESRRGDKEEESSRFRNYSSSRDRRSRSRSRSRNRSRDRSRDGYREPQMVSSHCINQMPYPVYYGPQPMMIGPIMPIRRQVPMPRGRLPPSLRPPRPYPHYFMPPNLFRLGPPSNYRFGPML